MSFHTSLLWPLFVVLGSRVSDEQIWRNSRHRTGARSLASRALGCFFSTPTNKKLDIVLERMWQNGPLGDLQRAQWTQSVLFITKMRSMSTTKLYKRNVRRGQGGGKTFFFSKSTAKLAFPQRQEVGERGWTFSYERELSDKAFGPTTVSSVKDTI